MNLNIANELATIRKMSNRQLRGKFAELFGHDARTCNNRVWLIRRILWRIQALAEGDLSERARLRATELANDADLRLSPPRPASFPKKQHSQPIAAPPKSPRADRLRSGTVLTRIYKGKMLQVTVLDNGFLYEGQVFSSLSALAKAITGSHCSGNRFFGLTSKGGQQ
jgi:Protein of unknown function (DUF2924)